MRRFLLALSIASSACDGGAAPAPADAGSDLAAPDAGPAILTGPSELVFPASAPSGPARTASVTLTNPGGATVRPTIRLEGDPRFTLAATPAFVLAGGDASVSVRFSGGTTNESVTGTLVVEFPGGELRIELFALVVGGLPAATYADVLGADGRPLGAGTTVALPTAPFPHASASYTDASVRIFVPEGYDDGLAHDVVLHFHGHSTTLAATLAAHRYEQQVALSGANVILVVPQGPVNAASGNFGKLMTPEGTRALLDDVLRLLARDGKILRPTLGQVSLTAHSGGYQAVAANLGHAVYAVRHAGLFDGLYGDLADYQAFAEAGGRFRSNYTTAGGTLANNQALAATLAPSVDLSEDAFLRDFRDTPSVIYFADTSHTGSTRLDNAYLEQLRFVARSGRDGGRIELESSTASGGTATVRFLAPPDPARTGIRVEISTDGTTFTTAASAPADASSASFSLPGPRYVRVRAERGGSLGQVSDTHAVAPDAALLVVDAFDRVLGGSFAGAAHDFAARVGVPLGASTATSRALVEGGFDLTGFAGVVWLAGDTSLDDRPISPDEQGVLAAYLDGGGKLLVSGSEVAYALSGGGFLTRLGAAYAADDANVTTAVGVGPLASVGAVSFGGGAYVEDFPDVLTATAGSVPLLTYGAGTTAAAVGRANEAALLGFPLELVAEPSRTALARALLAHVGLTVP